MIRAVIFDMDGVLIDSEIVYLRGQVDKLRETYPWIREDHLYPLVGMDNKEDKVFLAELLGHDANDPAFLSQYQSLHECCNADYPSIMRPQVPELLKTLQSMGLRIALASSSSRENIMHVLTTCRIRPWFECIVSGHEFTRSKPDPEIYRYTMDRLSVKPEECLIVEDSTYGVQAGHAAGACVTALKDNRFPFDQSLADYHIDTLDEVIGILKQHS